MADNFKYADAALVFCWLLISVLKVYLTQIILFEHEAWLSLLFSILFWLSGSLLICRAMFCDGIEINSFTVMIMVLLLLSCVNYALISFIFALFAWYAIGRLVNESAFRFCYLANFSLLIVLIVVTVYLHGQTYYYDGRYGSVSSFGFANSNSFPQLLLILFLACSCKLRYIVPLALLLFLLFFTEIKTRTFYLILVIYPLYLLIAKAGIPKIASAVVFLAGIISLVLVFSLHNDWVIKLDSLLSYRLSFAAQLIYPMQEITDYLLGVTSRQARMLTIPMDISYIVVLFRYGIVAGIFLGWLYWRAIHKLLSQQHHAQVAFILCFLSYAFIENVLVNYLLNPTLFYVFHSLYGQANKSQDNKIQANEKS